MAIDTAIRRRSALGMLPIPDGVVSSVDRRSVLGIYSFGVSTALLDLAESIYKSFNSDQKKAFARIPLPGITGTVTSAVLRYTMGSVYGGSIPSASTYLLDGLTWDGSTTVPTLDGATLNNLLSTYALNGAGGIVTKSHDVTTIVQNAYGAGKSYVTAVWKDNGIVSTPDSVFAYLSIGDQDFSLDWWIRDVAIDLTYTPAVSGLWTGVEARIV